ncbi:hypothetical protein RhiJN_19701 [Ceratobasidium sp. AG-Ba]|nr:hypothetical protein RhiJN_04871 [Ceratobasidium sp. AG-Ba]QRV91683.1 hypothetical protein RhiJN_19701 [Ceratobasidium sp. AG-Ba]
MQPRELRRLFTQVGSSDVYVSYPEQRDAEKAGRAPRVIIIFGWMGAPLSQLYRFTETYHQIYPSATQILIRVYRRAMFSELPSNKAQVRPAVKLLHDAGINAYDPPESSGLLVHAISNGGAMTQTYLAHCLSDNRPAPSPKASALPAQALIYDSVPSEATLSTFLNFFTTGIPSPALRTIAKPLLLPAYAGMLAYKHTIDRRPDMFTTLRAEMSDERLMPQRAPQLYIYGDIDLLTPAGSVEKYIASKKEVLDREGVEADQIVTVEKYEASPHVSHAKRDPKRYWAAVIEVWETSCRDSGWILRPRL